MTDYTKEHERDRKILFDYAMKGEWDKAVKLYKQRPSLRQEKLTVYGDTALHIAVLDGPVRVVEEMVELVSNRKEYDGVLKSKNEDGNTPLHLAASMPNVLMCKCIARKGEDLLQGFGIPIRNKDGNEDEDHLISIPNKDGETPLFLAARSGQTEAFLCLQREASESARLRNKKGETVLHCALAGGNITPHGQTEAQQREASEPALLRNKKGETILHCALAGGNFKLAFLIFERYEDLGTTYDERGVTPLRLLANQPTAFISGARLNLIDRIIYQSISVCPPSSGDAATSDRPAGRQTLPVKLLPVPWINNIKGLLFLIVTFIKISINPSNGAKVENARMTLDEENRLTPDRAGPSELNNEKGKKEGLSQRNCPVNYDTCFTFIMLLINAILGIGRSYVDKIREMKEKHVLCAKILEKIFDKAKGDWYDSTGQNPLYKNTTNPYKKENRGSDLSHDIPEMNPECEVKGQSGAPGLDSSLQTPEKPLEREKISKKGTNEKVVPKQVEEFQRSTDSMHKLLEQAQTNGLSVVNDKSQKKDKSIKETAVNEKIQKLDKSTKEETEDKSCKENGRDPNTGTPTFLVAVKNGIIEIVRKILKTHPSAIHEVDPDKKNALLLAVEHRQYHVIIHLGKKYWKIKSVFGAVDQYGNNALHLSATYKPEFRLDIPEGFQMQTEILLYETMERLVPKHYYSSHNINDNTPLDEFRKTHDDLLKTGKKWLKETSTQCSALAGIIASITFAASTSIPSDTSNNGKRPSFDVQAGFTIFAVSSLVALSFSMTSAVVFLTIANSSYTLEQFARIVPRMLFFGFLTLFISIGATLMSFCGAHIYTLSYKLRYAAIPLYALVFLPLILFSLAQIRSSYLSLPLASFKVNTEDIH